MSAPLAALRALAADRLGPARNWSGPVVGVVGPDVPVELITALGGLSVRLHGRPDTDATLGDRYLGAGVDPWARALLSALLRGDWPGLDAIVVGRDSEASSRLFFALRELHRIGLAGGLPPVLLCDVLHLPHRSTTRYVTTRLGQLRQSLAALTTGGDRGDLARAVTAHDRLRALLAQLTAVRRQAPARLSGVDALAVHAAAQSAPVDQVIPLLESLVAELPGRPPLPGLRVHLTGSSHDDPAVYRQMEADGLLVVSEDHDWGDPLGRRPVGPVSDADDAVAALAERYQYAGPTAQRSSGRRRADLLSADLAAAGPDLVISYLRERDDAPAWDTVAQRAVCTRLGVPYVVLENQPYGHVDLGLIREGSMA